MKPALVHTSSFNDSADLTNNNNELSELVQCSKIPECLKRCRACSEFKDVNDFPRKGRHRSGQLRIDSICKACKRKKEQMRYKKITQILKTRKRISGSLIISECKIVEIPAEPKDPGAFIRSVSDFVFSSILDFDYE